MSGELAADARASSPARGAGLGSRLRLFSATAFVGAALAFTLPFGTVSSCEGEEVRFTGVQLATFDVPPDPSSPGTLHGQVESNAGLFAVAVLLLAVLGFACVLGGARGGGVFASLGLVAAQLLGLAILVSGTSGATLLAGFWLALLSLAVAGVTHLVLAIRVRRRAGRRVRAYAVVRCALALSPVLVVTVVVALVLLAGA
jgi:hypothetical protein